MAKTIEHKSLKWSKGSLLAIISNASGHGFKLGDLVTVKSVGKLNYVVEDKNGVRRYAKDADFEYTKPKVKQVKTQTTNMTQIMKDAVLKTAKQLMKPNGTVTTLEIKLQLRKDEPNFYWTQAIVSQLVDELVQANELKVVGDNGTYRTYGDPASAVPKSAPAPVTGKLKRTPVQTTGVPTKSTISRTKALDLMKNNKGHFFTAVFDKKKGDERIINCQYLKDQGTTDLGYVKVREASKLKSKDPNPIRNVNLQTLKSLKIAGHEYKIK